MPQHPTTLPPQRCQSDVSIAPLPTVSCMCTPPSRQHCAATTNTKATNGPTLTDVPTRPQRQHCHQCPANVPPTHHCAMVLPLTPHKCTAPPLPHHLGPAPMTYHPRAAADALLTPTLMLRTHRRVPKPYNAQPPPQQCSSANVPPPIVMPTSH